MPTPRPETSLICSAVEKPGREEQLARPRRVDGVDLTRVDQAALGRLAGDAGGIDAPAVVAHA